MLVDVLTRVIADWLVIAIGLIGLLAALGVPRKLWYQGFGRALLTGLVALLLAKISSLLYQGERPFVEMGVLPKAAYLNNPGFPSDHALLVVAITVVVWATTKKVWLGLTLAVLSLLVIIGRVIALVHTPFDVLGGAACAILAGCLVYGRFLFTKKPFEP